MTDTSVFLLQVLDAQLDARHADDHPGLAAAVEQPDDRAVLERLHRHSERHRIARALAERAEVANYSQRIYIMTFLL